MNSAESLVPASIRIACSSVEGASTLSEARVVGLYQYIYCVLLLPERDDAFNVPGATSTETGVFCELRVYGVLRSSHSGDSTKFAYIAFSETTGLSPPRLGATRNSICQSADLF